MAAERAAADAGRQPHQLTPAWLFSRTQPCAQPRPNDSNGAERQFGAERRLWQTI
jgi:hypothetical protein